MLIDKARELHRIYGLMPVPVNGKAPIGGTGWNLQSLEQRLALMPQATGLGIQFGGPVFSELYGRPVEYRGLDIDLYEALQRDGFLNALAPSTGLRWGRGPALVVATEPGIIKREKYGTLQNGKAAVQLLGAGKQAVWWGRHPDGFDYRHPNGDLLSDFMPPFIEAAKLDSAIILALARAGIPDYRPSDVSKVEPISASELAYLTPENVQSIKQQMFDEFAAVSQLPDGSGGGAKLSEFGTRYGALIKAGGKAEQLMQAMRQVRRAEEVVEYPEIDALAEFSAFAEQLYFTLPGDLQAGRMREFARGVGASKGLTLIATARSNQAARQAFIDWRTGQPRPWVIDGLNVNFSATRKTKLPERLSDLMRRPVAPIEHLVQGMIPACSTFLIVADPKAGKTYMTQDLTLHIAEGSAYAGMQCKQSSVLYIAFEEQDAQVKDRIQKLRPQGVPESVASRIATQYFDDGVPQLGADFKGGLLEHIDICLEIDPTLRTIAMDTLQEALGDIEGVGNKNAYKVEKKALQVLTAYAKARGITIIILHHTNKDNSGSTTRKISGSQGILGGTDGYVVLELDNDNRYQMRVRGTARGVGHIDMEWVRDMDTPHWSPLGSLDETGKATTQADRVFSVLVAANCELTTADIALRVPNLSNPSVVLSRLRKEGRIMNPRRDIYSIANARSRDEAVCVAVVKSGLMKELTPELRALHDEEDRHHRASHIIFEDDMVSAIESAGFAEGKASLKRLSASKLALLEKGVVWLFGVAWQSQPMEQLPWALPPSKPSTPFASVPFTSSPPSPFPPKPAKLPWES